MSANPVPIFGQEGLAGTLRVGYSARARSWTDPQLAEFLAQGHIEGLGVMARNGPYTDLLQGLAEQIAQHSGPCAAAEALPTGRAANEMAGETEVGDSLELRWLATNAAALGAYRGEWLLIVGYALAAHSRDFGDILRTVSERNLLSPFVYYVPTTEESIFVAI